MNRVFLIGNGFDISLGLKTSYTNFFSYYKEQLNDDNCIIQLKNSINQNIENWSDFEKAFGEYTTEISNTTQFDIIYDDVVSNLREYLKTEDDKFSTSTKIHIEQFVKCLLMPESFIRENTKRRKIEPKNKDENIRINTIIFNYTKTFETIIKMATEVLNRYNKYRILEVEHIHGLLAERFVFGVNDETQISNENFKTNDTIKGEFIKPNFNQKLEHGIDDKCIAQIRYADQIFVYGMSIGETDKFWWKLIGEHLKATQCQLIIYHWEKEPFNLDKYKIRKEENIRDYFMSMAEINEKNISDRIIVACRTKLFQELYT